MFAKPVVALLLALMTSAVVVLHAHAAKQTRCPGFYGIDDTNISAMLLPNDSRMSWKQPCRNNGCRAAREIECVVDAYAHRLHPNFSAYPSQQDAEWDYGRYGRNIQALGQEHPGRIPLYCKLLARVAATIPGETADAVQKGARDWTAYNVTDMAIRLDRPSNHCLAGVVAAAPKTEEARRSMEYALNCLRHIRQCQTGMDPPLR